jgi:DNA-binding NarL/FixJ family response regulator
MKGLRMTRAQGARPQNEGKEREAAQAQVHLATVIASVPGFAEQSLRATLESLPSVRVVGTAAGCLSAWQMVRDRQADLVVIDANLPLEDVQVFLHQLKREGLKTWSLVLAATDGQVRRALAAGADVALRRDAPVSQLGAVVATFHRASPIASQAPGDETQIEE